MEVQVFFSPPYIYASPSRVGKVANFDAVQLRNSVKHTRYQVVDRHQAVCNKVTARKD